MISINVQALHLAYMGNLQQNHNWTIWIKAFGRFRPTIIIKFQYNFCPDTSIYIFIYIYNIWREMRSRTPFGLAPDHLLFRCINLCRKMFGKMQLHWEWGRFDRFNALKSKHVLFYHILPTTVTYDNRNESLASLLCFVFRYSTLQMVYIFHKIQGKNSIKLNKVISIILTNILYTHCFFKAHMIDAMQHNERKISAHSNWWRWKSTSCH